MIFARAYAKINWALDILATRENGYHDLDMLMQSVSLSDELTFSEAEDVTLTTNGQPDPYAEKNLIVRAARLLQKEAGCSRGARICLTKRIPAMAGMGGGSADCAAALKALNRLWELKLTDDRLLELGFSLGADVPFCLTGGLCRVKGLGEILEKLDAPAPAQLVIVMPDGGLSTGAVFGGYDRMERKTPPVDMEASRRALIAGDYRELNRTAGNVLTGPAMQVSGAIEGAIDDMYRHGAVMARMSGSGSAVFGVFDDRTAARKAQAEMTAAYGFCECAGTVPAGVDWEERI